MVGALDCWGCSSMAEQCAVNAQDDGSSPSSPSGFVRTLVSRSCSLFR